MIVIACPWEQPAEAVVALLPSCRFEKLDPDTTGPVFATPLRPTGWRAVFELRMRRHPAFRGSLLLGGPSSHSAARRLPYGEILDAPGTWLLGHNEPSPVLTSLTEAEWNSVRRTLRRSRPADLDGCLLRIAHELDTVVINLLATLGKPAPEEAAEFQEVPDRLSGVLASVEDQLELSSAVAERGPLLAHLCGGYAQAVAAGHAGDVRGLKEVVRSMAHALRTAARSASGKG